MGTTTVDAVRSRGRTGRRAAILAAAVAAFVIGGALAAVTGPSTTAAAGHADEPSRAPAVPGSSPDAGDTGAAPAPTTTAPPGPVTMVFGGDIHFDGPLAARLEADPASIFDGLQPTLREADLAVVNLETAIGGGGRPVAKAFNFRASAAALPALTDAGVDVISMANNHGLDFGTDGLRETLDAIDFLDAPVIGIGRDEAQAYRPFTTTINGQRIAVIAATSVLDANLIASWTATPTQAGLASAKRTDRLLDAVRAAREDADTVVVFLHWGTEKMFCPNGNQRELAPALVFAGADVVVGGHAHRVLGGGFMGNAYVHYGLGNLVFRTSGSDARDTGLLRLTVTGRRIDAAEWLPGRIGTDFTPVLLSGADAERPAAVWHSRRECTGLAPFPAG